MRPENWLSPLCGFRSVASAFTNYPAAQAIAHPLFTPFDDDRMHQTNVLTIVDAELRAKLLGDAIPAESFAAGANTFPVLISGRDGNLEFDCTTNLNKAMRKQDIQCLKP